MFQAEEFVWNDHIVVPLAISGGAANGSYGLPMKVFNTPIGVDEADWNNLSNNKLTPEEIAKSICRIIIHLKKSILNQHLLTLEESATSKLKKSIKKKMIDDKLEVLNRKLEEDQSDNVSQNSSPEKVLPVVEDLKADETKKKGWSRITDLIKKKDKKKNKKKVAASDGSLDHSNNF